MTDQDLERAVTEALEAGLQSAEEIVAYIIEQAAPIELRGSAAEKWRSKTVPWGIISRLSDATH